MDLTTSMSPKDIQAVIAHCARQVLPHLGNHQFKRDDRLVELGANSIDRSEIVLLVLESMNLPLPRTAVHGARDLGELADLLHEKSRCL